MAHRTAHGGLHHAHIHQALYERSMPVPLGSSTSNDRPSLVQRSDHTCGADHTSTCEKDADTAGQGSLVIGLAAAIPITVALIVLFFLHRRIKRKMKHEDANDKHKSLDFGMDDVIPSGHARKGRISPEMTINTENRLGPGRRNRGLSMDLDLASPYLLPDAANGSRDSLHSLSRTHSDPNDPYRPSVFGRPASRERDRSPSRLRHGSAVEYDEHNEKFGDPHRAGLLRSAALMPQNDIPTLARNSEEKSRQLPSVPPPRQASLPKSPQKQDRWYPADDTRYGSESPPDISGMAPQTPHDMLSNGPNVPSVPPPARQPLPPTPMETEDQAFQPDMSNQLYLGGDAFRITVPSPTHNRQSPPRSPAALPSLPKEPIASPEFQFELDPPPVPSHESDAQNVYEDYHGVDARRVSVMGMRPLPPDDPSDNPEQRANRIRSFYREYFDDTKPNPPGQYPVPAVPSQYAYHDDHDHYGSDPDDGMVYDPETGAFYYSQVQKPFAEPINRRAMTPPPRAPGQMRGGHRSVMSTQSAGRPMAPPKKRLPPPKALTSIPTPHLLRDDVGLTDFAPRTTFRDRQLGRAPDSPLGASRPFSPAFRPHTPLAGSFDDLAVMPSPHALRKSGTFTALDFAPPPKFRENGDTMSDSGSIRSNRSGMSALQRDAIRAGAYRLSRLPTDQVGTHQDLAHSLRPQWDLNR